jgi:hypothetical protein
MIIAMNCLHLTRNLRLAADRDNLGRETLALSEQALPPLDQATHTFLK